MLQARRKLMSKMRIIIFWSLIWYTAVFAQQPGSFTPETHPTLISERCSKQAGCVKANTSIVLDSNFRWLHNKEGTTNCITQGFNKTICPNAETCGKSCFLEGVDYKNYGLKTTDNGVTMNLFMNTNGQVKATSARIYLYDEDQGSYALFKLVNQEFTFDIDTSKSGCGVNGALYFSEMSATGDWDDINNAGAKYGTGYCDAQCPKQNFIKGRVRNAHITYIGV
jgi:cellulose 1,4-beta-cellobiosidase